ncbi:DinB family protein [Candidatus Sulfopaludibacter sp. SbA3]|nr:DinB family protein [Candidatus Sulfopaludibacter sp. SbA3]
MNYYGAQELAASFRTVRKNTLTIAEEIGEAHYGFRVTPDTRTIGQTLVHIAHVCELQEHVHGELHLTALEGFDFMGFIGPLIADEQTARTKEEVIALLRESGERFAHWLDGLSNEFLGETVAMPPGMTPATKSRFEMILGVKEHEMHHRGQLMVMERMVGVVPHLTREFQARIAAMTASATATAKA